MKKEMKFLMVINDMAWFWSHRLPLAKAIQKQGWTLHLCAAAAQSDQKVEEMGVIPHNLPASARGINLFKHLAIVIALAKTIRTLQPDIIHAITIRYALYTALAARFVGTGPLVFTIAGLGTLFTHKTLKSRLIRLGVLPLLRFAFSRDNVFLIFQNSDDQRLILEAGIVHENQTSVIRGSGVDISEFPFAPEEETQEALKILFTSRLLKEKGIYDFVDAARLLKAKGIEARFQVAGDVDVGNPHSILADEIKGWEKEDALEWLGQCRDMPKVLKESAMVVLPSYYGEGVPKVLLEAAAIGRPVITCDMPGCREAVAHEVNGFLVPPKDSENLAAAIETLLKDPEKRKAFGAAGRKRVEDDFNVESVNAQTLAVYNQVR